MGVGNRPSSAHSIGSEVGALKIIPFFYNRGRTDGRPYGSTSGFMSPAGAFLTNKTSRCLAACRCLRCGRRAALFQRFVSRRRQVKLADQTAQTLTLLCERLASRCRLFGNRGILLCHLVHMPHCCINFSKS